MTGTERTKREYGGFLPLELNPGEEYLAGYEPRLSRFNSVKAALFFLIHRIGIKRIYIPYYYCPSTTEAIRRTGAEVRFYHIGEDLLPANLPDEPESAVLLVDYFGVRGEQIGGISTQFSHAEVILDRAHGFFGEPVISERAHNVYSAKKFFGVPDGAYLVSEVAGEYATPLSSAHGYAAYLLTAYEAGTNAAYREKKAVDAALAERYDSMSVLAAGLLRNVDYRRVRQQRERNYGALHVALAGVNALALPEAVPAYHYPLLLNGLGRTVKKRLIEERIYVPTLWAGETLIKHGSPFERGMMDDCVFLPVDQRYDVSDIRFISERVRELINDYS